MSGARVQCRVRGNENAPEANAVPGVDLLARLPPGEGPWTGEQKLWWAMLRQAVWDLRFTKKRSALSALAFLCTSGVWLYETLFKLNKSRLLPRFYALARRRRLVSRIPQWR